MPGDELSSGNASGDLVDLRSEIESFIGDARREIAELISLLQSGIDEESPTVAKPQPEAQPEPPPPSQVPPSQTTAHQTPAATGSESGGSEDRLEQLKRRIEEQLRDSGGDSSDVD